MDGTYPIIATEPSSAKSACHPSTFATQPSIQCHKHDAKLYEFRQEIIVFKFVQQPKQ